MKIAHIIGRFQPFHLGHHAMVEHALSIADKVLILIGDTGCARDSKDPFTPEQRIAMITACFENEVNAGKIAFATVFDNPYDDAAWALTVEQTSRAAAWHYFGLDEGEYDRVLVGHHKDASSRYLSFFSWPQSKSPVTLVVPPFGKPEPIDATKVRKMLMDITMEGFRLMPEKAADVLKKQLGYGIPDEALQDHLAVARFERASQSEITLQYGKPHLHAADALVVHRGHVLLIERASGAGKGAVALPGGFMENDEWPLECAVRELLEETGVDITGDYIGRHQDQNLLTVFADPARSRRGRTSPPPAPIRVSGDATQGGTRRPSPQLKETSWKRSFSSSLFSP